MACKSVKVTVYFDLKGKQTGEFKFQCEGTCTPTTDSCFPVRYVNEKAGVFEYYCKCVTPSPAGKEFATPDPPPGDGVPCGNIKLVQRRVEKGKKEDVAGFEFEPVCVGSCTDPKRVCTVVGEEGFDTKYLPDGSWERVKIKTYHCECLPKKRWL